MKNINDNIKNLLNDTNTEVHNRVEVCEEAIYGDLGNQLLLSWDNISSNFPNFMDNFENSKDYIIENVARICDKYPLYND